ncbi:hypothetical protein V1478_016265 [Vespula squamosa]|uniref:Uncharacterized protein n=1 Tax=Vespula squamosa TaxID=30214 RepID=A0ABD1ZZE7_VESSQ
MPRKDERKDIQWVRCRSESATITAWIGILRIASDDDDDDGGGGGGGGGIGSNSSSNIDGDGDGDSGGLVLGSPRPTPASETPPPVLTTNTFINTYTLSRLYQHALGPCYGAPNRTVPIPVSSSLC